MFKPANNKTKYFQIDELACWATEERSQNYAWAAFQCYDKLFVLYKGSRAIARSFNTI